MEARNRIAIEVEVEVEATECECLDFMYGDYGNCKKLYKDNSKYPICYISDTACCKDRKWSSSAGKYYSWRACAPGTSFDHCEYVEV